METTRRTIATAWMVPVILVAAVGAAQTPDADRPGRAEGMVSLNFPENVQLQALIDYVGKRRDVNFLYDEQIGNMRVTIKAPREVPAESLMALLDGVLKMKGLVMSETDVAGMMRIDVAKPLTASSVGPRAAVESGPAVRPTLAMTRVFELEHAAPKRAAEVLTPFLSATTANLTALSENRMLIVTDYATNMDRIEELLDVVDRPRPRPEVRFVPVRHTDVGPMAKQLKQLLDARSKASGVDGAPSGDVAIHADERTNQMVIVGTSEGVAPALSLIESLDVPLGLSTKIYTLVVASPERIDHLIRKAIGESAARRLYHSATDIDANLLIATTTPEIHEQIDRLRTELDRPPDESRNPVRFYKLENAKAVDVLDTLRNLEGDTGLSSVTVEGASGERSGEDDDGIIIKGPTPEDVNRVAPAVGSSAPGTGSGQASPDAGGVRVMADEATNAIIVVADPAMQSVYAELIKRLDVRRPQVLIEATVVTLDTTDDFALGVEFKRADDLGDDKGTVLNFTSFGLNTKNPTTGVVSITPSIGYSGALLSPDIARIVLQALQSDSRAKVVSRPSVVVNDNATATLLSEREEPFASVNASTTVATTSFAGYSSAGTKIAVVPQISEGDHLKLEYEITLSDFGDDTSDTLPPARQTNALTSEATIPDAYTIVVGGLTRENHSEAIDRVPVLGKIPGLEYLFSNRVRNKRRTTLFVFIRATILRDDKFADLKFISRDAAGRAGVGEDFPASTPLEVH